MEILNQLQQALMPLIAWVGSSHQYLQALLTFTLFFLLAMVFNWFAALVVHQLVKKTNNRLDDQIFLIIKKPLFTTVLLVGAAVTFSLLGLSEAALNIVLAILMSIGVFIWALFFLRLSKLLLQQFSHETAKYQLVSSQTLPLFENIAFLVTVVFALYLVFSAWNIDMTAWLASAGIVGIAVGFAAKDTLANLFSGVFILADAPYKIGDFIVLDSGERGEVTHIGIRSTRMLTRDDVEVTVPNAIMGNTKVLNESGGRHEKFRIRLKVGVAYGSDINRVRSLLMTIAKETLVVCGDPEPRVRFRLFGDSALMFELLCWIDQPVLRGQVLDQLHSKVYENFNAENIEIAYNKQDIYIKELPGQALINKS